MNSKKLNIGLFSIWLLLTIIVSVNSYASIHSWEVLINGKPIAGKSHVSLVGYRGEILYRIKMSRSDLPSVQDLAVRLGLISDADEAFWNGIRIGSTGIYGVTARIAPHVDRTYRIGNLIQDENVLLVRVLKVAGDPTGIGIQWNQPKFGTFKQLSRESSIYNFFRSLLPLLLGVIIIFFGIYHMFIYCILRKHIQYREFGATLLSFGVFSICYSFVPYEYFDDPFPILVVHSLSSFFAIYFYGRYLIKNKSSISKWINRLQFVIACVFSLMVLMAPVFDIGLKRYFAWYIVFLPSLIVYFSIALFREHKESNWYILFVSTGLMFLALGHDVLLTLRLLEGQPWSTQIFMSLLFVSTLALGRDFAFAYRNVEQTVESRTKDLQVANEHLRALEEMKNRFYTNISHDFKSFLAIAFANIEEAKLLAVDVTKDALGSAQKALRNLQAMVLEFLDMVKAESGEIKLNWETVSVVKIIKAWAAPYEILCRNEGVLLKYDISVDEELKIPLDVLKMERVFANLMHNAIKFTKDGSITIGINKDAFYVYLKITDTGSGVEESEKEKIFDRYYQGNTTSLRDHGGSGIGLSFVKEVITAHNGKVWVESPTKSGSQFIVALPITQNVIITGEHIIDELRLGEGAEKDFSVVTYPNDSPIHYQHDHASLLIVEDNPEIAHVVVNALKDDYNIYFAKDGIDALDRLLRTKIHCIVSDIMMPRMDGKTFLCEVKKNTRWRSIPFVCLTSLEETQHMIECLKLGANNYVTKPFHREVLRSTILTLIENSNYREQLVKKDKMASLGLLSAGLAHEIRNPVMFAMNSLEGLRREFDRLSAIDFSNSDAAIKELNDLARKSDLVKQAFQDARHSVSRIHAITEAIGSYTTGSTLIVETDVVNSISQVLKILEGKRKELGVSIHFSNQHMCIVNAFASLQQAFMNVLDNAIDAASEKGQRVNIIVNDLQDEVQITIQDSGSGIALDQQTHIFDAFYTAKSNGKGTGLGLYITKAIIEYQHLGSITVHSEEGEGTTFIIHLKKIPNLKDRDMITFKGFLVPI